MSDNSKPAEGEQPENPEQHGLFWPPLADEAPSKSAGTVPLDEATPPRQWASREAFLNAVAALNQQRAQRKVVGAQQPMPPLAGALDPRSAEFLAKENLLNRPAVYPSPTFQELIQQSAADAIAKANRDDDPQQEMDPFSGAMVQLDLGSAVLPTTAMVRLGPTVPPPTDEVGIIDTKTIFEMMRGDATLSGMGVVPDNLMSAGAMLLVREFIERLDAAQRLAACKALVEEAIAAVKSALPHEKPRRCHTTSNVEGDEELERRVSVSITNSVKRILPSVEGLDHFIRGRVTRFFSTFWKPQEIDLTQDRAGISAEFITIIDEMIEDEAFKAELEFRAEEADKPPDARMHSLADEHLMPTTRDTTLDVFGATAVKTAAKEEEPDSEDDSEDDSEGDQHLQMSQRSARLLREVDSILVRRYEDEADVNFQVLNLTVELIRQKYRRDNISSPS